MPSAALVERELEFAALERLLAGAREGAGGAALVEGPAGIGKSSLLAAARAAAADLWVVSARGGELEREFPFGVARQLLEPVLVAADEHGRERLLAGAAGLAERVLSAPDHDGSREPPFAALHGLHWLTVNLAGFRPLLVVVDDVHWADLPSLRWLVYLARRLEGVPVALLLAARPVGPGEARELLDELVAIPELEVVHPGDLSEDAVGGLARQLLVGEPDREFVAACRRATGGNPFLLRELLGELSRRGIVPSRENAGLASQVSSLGVGRSVRARLRGLAPECAALARAVAVLGDPAAPSLAARLAGLDEHAAWAAAGALAGAAIMEAGRPLAFVHPLVRSSVYAELSASQRAAQHERAARLLAGAGAAADRIAQHLLSTRPRGDGQTVETLRRAAALASGRGAPEVAVTYLNRALEEPPAGELQAVLAYELGLAALRAGELQPALEGLREAMRGLPRGRMRAEAANALGTALFLAQGPDEAFAELSAAIDELPESAREQGLRLQVTRLVAARGSLAAWRALQASGDRFVVATATPQTTGERLQLAVPAFEAVRAGTAADARGLALRALSHGRLLDDPGPEYAGFWPSPSVLAFAYASEELTRIATDVIEWAERHGSPTVFAMGAQLRAYAWWQRGALADAEADAAGALEHTPLPGFPPWGYAALVNVLLARGETTQAEDVLDRAPFELGSVRALYSLQSRARLRAAAGRPEDALEDLFACDRLERDWELRTPAFCTWRADAAPLLAALDRRAEALRLAREELERCRAFGAAAPLGGALRTLGALVPSEGGIALLEEAVGVLERSPARLEQALALVELGAARRRAGRRAEAREPLRAALELAVACGASIVATRAHDELITAGARPRRDPTESRSNLTAAELRVARLAAEGLTNRGVAEALFLTENTIETHLRSVFRKLDIRSRSQLARAL
jgi:DNA-binding CsgD family transcriptional regulator/tetratricopeptide (TPR) repeat protein